MVSAENETPPPGQEVLAGGLENSKKHLSSRPY